MGCNNVYLYVAYQKSLVHIIICSEALDISFVGYTQNSRLSVLLNLQKMFLKVSFHKYSTCGSSIVYQDYPSLALFQRRH